MRQTIQRVSKLGLVTKAPKTASSRRPMALGPDVVALLRRHRLAQRELRLAFGSIWEEHGFAFSSDRGTPLEATTVRRAVKRICSREGVPVIRIHDLRHTNASLLLDGAST